jgi:(R,R)-butanediol dehydrogenase/meso-butanediol dehydrogenase/diacetyl reductase
MPIGERRSLIYAQTCKYIHADVKNKGHIDPKVLISSVEPLNNIVGVFAWLRGANQETKVHIAGG